MALQEEQQGWDLFGGAFIGSDTPKLWDIFEGVFPQGEEKSEATHGKVSISSPWEP